MINRIKDFVTHRTTSICSKRVHPKKIGWADAHWNCVPQQSFIYSCDKSTLFKIKKRNTKIFYYFNRCQKLFPTECNANFLVIKFTPKKFTLIFKPRKWKNSFIFFCFLIRKVSFYFNFRTFVLNQDLNFSKMLSEKKNCQHSLFASSIKLK